MELLKVIIHLARRHQFSITNVYLPPLRSDCSSNHQNDQSWLDHFSKEPDLVCVDFNVHSSSWDYYVSTDLWGSALRVWMEAHLKVLLIDGSPTRAVWCDKSAGVSMPDVSLVDTVMSYRFSWETISELGSGHLPLLLIWAEDIKVERDHARRRPNYPTADCLLFRKCFRNGIHAVSSVRSLSKRLETYCNLNSS